MESLLGLNASELDRMKIFKHKILKHYLISYSKRAVSDNGIEKENVMAFGVCLDCSKKFLVKIVEYGRVAE